MKQIEKTEPGSPSADAEVLPKLKLFMTHYQVFYLLICPCSRTVFYKLSYYKSMLINTQQNTAIELKRSVVL